MHDIIQFAVNHQVAITAVAAYVVQFAVTRASLSKTGKVWSAVRWIHGLLNEVDPEGNKLCAKS